MSWPGPGGLPPHCTRLISETTGNTILQLDAAARPGPAAQICVKISNENSAAAASDTRYKSGFGQNIHQFDEGLFGSSFILAFYRIAFISLNSEHGH